MKHSKPLLEQHTVESAIKRVGEKLQKLRQEKGISRAKFAIMSGLSVSQITRLENGIGQPPISTYLKCADALDVSLAAILQEERI